MTSSQLIQAYVESRQRIEIAGYRSKNMPPNPRRDNDNNSSRHAQQLTAAAVI
jgi:hypothetical protein